MNSSQLAKKLIIISIYVSVCSFTFAEDKWASAEINVRTGPGTQYDIMGQLYKNEKVEVFDAINGWAQILFENVEGYVREDLLLSERIKTPEEEESARIAQEFKKARQEKEHFKSRILHILIVIIGVAGTILIVIRRKKQ